VQSSAGIGSGFLDEEYEKSGAKIDCCPGKIITWADMIVNVKEPQDFLLQFAKEGQIIFSYFHLAASRELTEKCLKTKIIGLAYETLTDNKGELPLLKPMSEVAGRMSIQEGAKYLEKPMGGKGVLLGGVPGVEPAKVVILGGGIVGINAAKIAAGVGANVVIMDINLDRLRYLSEIMPANVHTVFCNESSVKRHVIDADLVIGAVLIPGGKTPVLVTKEIVKQMIPGSVIVDVCVDQGGCIETSRPTTHENPTFIVDGIVHYCVANMPGAVGRTSTIALCNATFPYILQVATLNNKKNMLDIDPLDLGYNVQNNCTNIKLGRIINKRLKETFPDLC
jgi:alanine dehydrogenase